MVASPLLALDHAAGLDAALSVHLSPLGLRAGAGAPEHRSAPSRDSLSLASRLILESEEDRRAVGAAPPVLGLAELRERWRSWQRRGVREEVPSSLPIVTAGLSHSLSLLADLFGGERAVVAVSAPFWGNYRQAFATRTGAEIRTGPAYVGGRYNPEFAAQALHDLPLGQPALVLLNIPSNPGGYTPDVAEREATIASLRAEADRRPLLVICDDAYAGLTFEPEISPASLVWDLVGLHPQLVPVKVDGATKEFSFFGGRIGFLTFAVPPASPTARSLEDRLALLLRSSVGSASGASQVLLLQALRTDGIEAQVEEVRLLLEGRYRALKGALAQADADLLQVLPFNSGCFALVEISETLGIDSESARRSLLQRWETGLISLAPRYLRIAHCSVDAASLPELATRLQRGIAALAGR